MRHRCARSPASLVLHDFDRLGVRAGHENAGFLSFSHGFVPRAAPLTRLSDRFGVWDQLASELPELHRSLLLRKRVHELPVLDASASALPASELLRAAALLAIVSHAYWYMDPRVPTDLPEALRRPWAQVRERLARQGEVLSYIDLIVYNWRLIDPARPDPMALENLELLFPTIGNQEERVFYLTQLEILARASPAVPLIAAAQDAVLRQEDRAIEAALDGLVSCLSAIVRRSLLKLDPNPYSPTHVNPVVWAKTVAPLAVPFHAGMQGPSGTSSPLFNTLDLFFGRKRYDSFLGREIKALRATYPRAWQSFLGALTEVSVGRYIERSGNRALAEVWAEALDLYAGQSGFLGRHRMKVYGYLELAFKVGRSVTIGGFGGVFKDRTWDLVDNELSAAQVERPTSVASRVQRAKIAEVGLDQACAGRVGRVVLDVSHLALRYQPGDRCLVLPENEPRVLQRTLEELGARGDELVCLTDEWKAQAAYRPELVGRTHLLLRDVLRFGGIRPVSARLAEALHARTQSRVLLQSLVDDRLGGLELWELLAELKREGLDAASLWRDTEGAPSERLCRLIPPLRCRVYSISSVAQDARGQPNPRLELTVGQLRYPASSAGASDPWRRGTASTFLVEAAQRDREVPFVIERPDRFVLPEDPSVPVVMFAGGTGISPFRAFLKARARREPRARDWLFLSLRSPDEFLYAEELGQAVARGALALQLAFTRVGARAEISPEAGLKLAQGPIARVEDLMLAENTALELWQLLLPKSEGGAGAHVYVCGRSGFANSVLDGLRRIFRRHVAHGSDALARLALYRLAGEGRLVQEIHSDTRPVDENPRRFDFSEVARHNSREHGYWMVIERVVYDLTEFMELHPGGRRIVQAYAGMDATHGFSRAHHQRPDVDAMRENYRIGVLRNYRFDDHTVQIEGPSGALTVDCTALHRCFVGALQLAVEMQNALSADQSLQREKVGAEPSPHSATPYKLARAVETHRRFLASYMSVLAGETLPNLWRLSRGLLFPEQPPEWMEQTISTARSGSDARRTRGWVDAFAEEPDAWLAGARGPEIRDILQECDAWFLAEIKETLCEGLRAFEQHGSKLRQLGAASVKDSCQHAARLVGYYYERLATRLAAALADEAALRDGKSLLPPAAQPAVRLHSGVYWLLEEDSARRLVVLQRTPVAPSSLRALSDENEQVLACLRPEHTEFGLVVDTRRAPLRNDAAFENTMARLRSGLTGHFQRTAVLLETSVGALQVERLTRDEHSQTLATCSESSAFKFALGGA